MPTDIYRIYKNGVQTDKWCYALDYQEAYKNLSENLGSDCEIRQETFNHDR